MRKFEFHGLSAVVLIQAAMIVACQADDILRPSGKQPPMLRFNSILEGDQGSLPVSSPTDPAYAVPLMTYPHRTAVSVLLSSTIFITPHENGTWYSSYNGALDGTGIFVSGVNECRVHVAIGTNATLHYAPGGCHTSPTPQSEWADTIIAHGDGSIFRSGGVPLTLTERTNGCGPYGGEICYRYNGVQSYSIRRVPADLELKGPPVVESGTSITDSAKVSPQLVGGKKIPFVVQRWRWFRGDSVPNTSYPPLTNPSGCAPPAVVDTNPSLCTVTSDTSGVLEIDAIVNGVPETLRKNISVVAGGRVCDGQVLKKWGRISSRYQANEALREGNPHRGRDHADTVGVPVYAAEAGVVVDAETGKKSGIRVVVRGNYNSYYFHLSGRAPGIYKGVTVAAGDLLGYVGNTGRSSGPHLHFQQHTLGPIWNSDGLAPAGTEVDPCYF